MWHLAAHSLNGSGQAAGSLDMVVLDKNAIAEAEAVVMASAQAHSLFFEGPQPRGGLTRIENAHAGAGHGSNAARGQGGDAGEVAEEVEGHTLGTQESARRSAEDGQRLIGDDRLSIADTRLALDTLIEQ